MYTPQSLVTDKHLTISGQAAHHATHVLRLRTGASIRVFDGQGCEHRAKLTKIARSGITLKIEESVAVTPESPLRLTLLQGIARNDRMDFILQKAVELGVQAIQPIWMQRSHTQLKGERLEKRINHWQGVITSACEQCGRATLPQLSLPQDYINWINAGTGSDLRLMLQPEARSCLRNLEKPASSISLLVGPEGGLAPEEQVLARATGFTGIRIGPRILRTETAALTALAGIQTLWGDFS
ncbi:MAG: 16S rRNA (uracil(1498)-N(3))-methyltransferase [Gammaproteobacteria bacterium]|nr:16S rRNA (uracil(1498)-N(3))-methyltransferase [Gammaproteobacteria bacterium]